MRLRYIFISSIILLMLSGIFSWSRAQEKQTFADSVQVETIPEVEEQGKVVPKLEGGVDTSPDLGDQEQGLQKSEVQGKPEMKKAAMAKSDSARDSGSRNRLEIVFDYLKLVSFASKTETKMEGGLGYISKINVGFNVEVGYGEKTPEDFYKNAEYKVYGYYGRAGISYYYPYNPDVNFIVGVKYAMAQYQDEATYSVLSTLWDDLDGDFQREALEASWVEFILGTESSVKGILYFGFVFRMRFLIQADNFTPFEVYSIPGYGRTFDTIVPALNLYIKLHIPFGKGR
jgi:hypothetical protein